jgi:large subunit ribosomal protein L3
MFILGKKLKMSQIWKGEKVVPVTIVKAVPNTVTLLRTKERDGYEAVQVALGKTRREARIRGKAALLKQLKVGDAVSVEAFKEGDLVRITGTSKGRGFQGVVKRHGFHGGPKTHGQKNRLRAPGSIGATAPQRVLPGRKMPGRMGGDRVTLRRARVVGVEPKEHLLLIKGPLPGMRGTLVQIQKIT